MARHKYNKKIIHAENFPVRPVKLGCTGKFLYLYGRISPPVRVNFGGDELERFGTVCAALGAEGEGVRDGKRMFAEHYSFKMVI
jgi:hypothetical protein